MTQNINDYSDDYSDSYSSDGEKDIHQCESKYNNSNERNIAFDKAKENKMLWPFKNIKSPSCSSHTYIKVKQRE